MFLPHKTVKFLRRIFCLITLVCFSLNTVYFPVSKAEAAGSLTVDSALMPLAVSPYPMLQGLKVFPENPLQYEFIVDPAGASVPDETLKKESERLIKYFMASLTVPEEEMWVNLSPLEKDRIVPQSFGTTEMGRDMLVQDYVLKQLTASLVDPAKDLGKIFWDKVYKKMYAKYGRIDEQINAFDKVWIVPDKAVVYENKDTVFVVESRMKVMMQEDHEAQKKLGEGAVKDDITPQIMREIIIPEIEKEVNEGESFAKLRQIYNSLILATWLKRKIKDSILDRIYIGKNKVAGVDIDDKNASEKIYQDYIKAFQDGVYNYVKEEYDPNTQEIIPRKYFSGGITELKIDENLVVKRKADKSVFDALERIGKAAYIIQAKLEKIDKSIVVDWKELQEKVSGLIKNASFDIKNAELTFNGQKAELIGDGDRNFIFKLNIDGRLMAARVFKKAGKDNDDKMDNFVMMAQRRYSPDLVHSGFVKNNLGGQNHVYIVELIDGKSLDKIEDFGEKEQGLVFDPLDRMAKEGVNLYDFTIKQIMIGRVGGGEEKAWIADPEYAFVQMPFDELKIVKQNRGGIIRSLKDGKNLEIKQILINHFNDRINEIEKLKQKGEKAVNNLEADKGVESDRASKFKEWAIKYAQNPDIKKVIDTTQVFRTVDAFMKEYSKLTRDDIPQLNERGEKIGPAYWAAVLYFADHIDSNMSFEAFQANVTHYQRALDDKEEIIKEIRRIYLKSENLSRKNNHFQNLLKDFGSNILLDKETNAPLAKSYSHQILRYAYKLYGKDLIRDLIETWKSTDASKEIAVNNDQGADSVFDVFMMRAGEYVIDIVLLPEEPLNSFDEFISWFRKNKKYLLDRRTAAQGTSISAGYALEILRARKKVLGFNDSWMRKASAYDYGQSNEVIRTSPYFATPLELIAWAEAKKASDLPNTKYPNEEIKISLSYLVLVLDVFYDPDMGRKIPEGSKEKFDRYVSAYAYGQDPKIKEFIATCPIKRTAEEFVQWYSTLTIDDIPRRDKPDQKISPEYLAFVLYIARGEDLYATIGPRITIYQRAINDRVIISGEIRRIFAAPENLPKKESLSVEANDFENLVTRFDPTKMSQSGKAEPISRGQIRKVLHVAYDMYGKELIAKLKGEKAVSNLPTKDKSTVGGIDFNPNQLIIDSKGQKIEFDINEELQKLEMGPFNGFIPIIINIKPVVNLPLMLGINLPADVPQKADHLSLLAKDPDPIPELVGIK